jgi:hypothetical protein
VASGAPLLLALVVVLGSCQGPRGAALDGRVTSVSLPPHTRLTVQVCERADRDCNRWLYPDVRGGIHVDQLEPGDYAITVFLETPSGLALLTSSVATLLVGQTTEVDLIVPAIPSQPAT